MATRSDISILKPNGTIATQYIHMDGNLGNVGQNLLNNYKTMADADQIQELGAYHADSTLPKRPEDIISKLSEYSKDPNYISQGYSSLEDMKRDLTSYSEYPRDYGQVDKTLNSDVEYHYLYAPNEKGKYQWHTINRDGIKPLTQEIISAENENGITGHSANWHKAPNGEWNTPLTNEESHSLNKDVKLMVNQNLKAFDERQLKQVEKVFSSNKVSASWYLQRNKVEDEALDNAYADWGSKNHTEAKKLKEMESKLSTKQVDYFDKLYDITRDKTLAASNTSRLSKNAEQKIESMVPKEESKQTNETDDIFDYIAKINKQTAEENKKEQDRANTKIQTKESSSSDEKKQKEQYMQYLAQQGLER